MVFVLIIGDFHIPHRTYDVPTRFKKLLVPGKIEIILSTGNLTNKETREYLTTLASDIHVVKGDFDDDNLNLPENDVVVIDGIKFGLVHGHDVIPWGDHDSLGVIQRKLGVDILIHGHTHEFSAFESEGKIFINPGSVTGAYSGFTEDVVPSFVLMDIQKEKIITYVYKLKNGELEVNKLFFSRPKTKESDENFD
ncbi:vacuolar protein sorting-associated protein [Anaeramoeba ignava]|uniref:Vacuolar protein sorting-associated protein 29 n=1 Tax=Anaeramoeba ignava TaxID=1746090 RepID=A0A9Q0RGC1_ANAIG|nr:vacuolar protein sorting-associated protein [Anaeramoeba ignava]|eukprot:Anaeramoba_ignava/a105612_25.p1 GENE.a105612_25~~a105612_25.p1  ORF type:complete len:195 (+),score=67.62 a105612_25:46-630(+)